jgi:hypothetical protein
VTTEHFDTAMSALLQRVPYRPFTIVLINGNRYEVDHPSAIMMRDGVAFYFRPGGIPALFDHEGVNELVGDLMEQPNDAA